MAERATSNRAATGALSADLVLQSQTASPFLSRPHLFMGWASRDHVTIHAQHTQIMAWQEQQHITRDKQHKGRLLYNTYSKCENKTPNMSI